MGYASLPRVAEIICQCSHIGPIVDAYDEIELRLSEEPELLGESRPRGRRIWIVPPLGVLFRIQPRLQEVYVVDLWMFEDRKQ